MPKKSGFTLVELLVVVSIIAILSVIGVAVFTNTQRTARDARRTGDIDAYSNAAEVKYNASTGVYTAPGDSDFSSGAIPKDPINTGIYVYTWTLAGDSKSYTICAGLEDVTKGNYGNATATATGTTHYCRKSQQ